MSKQTEFAPQYSKQEKIKLIAVMLIGGALVMGINHYWFFPELRQYGEHAHCFNYGSFTGAHVMMYFVFAALPLIMSISLFLLVGPRELRVIQTGQNPPPDEKTFKPTRYVYGWRARIRSYVGLGALLVIFGMGILGYFWANELIDRLGLPDSSPECEHITASRGTQ